MRHLASWILALPIIAIASDAAALTKAEVASEFDRGIKAYDAQHYEAAYNIWWHIKGQDLAAMRNVAFMLRKGQGIQKDPQKALSFLKAAAATGYRRTSQSIGSDEERRGCRGVRRRLYCSLANSA